MKRILAFFAAAVIATNGGAQSVPARDSLLQQIAAIKEDTAGVHLMLQFADLVANNEPALAATYAAKSLSLSKKLDYQEGTYTSLLSLAHSFSVRGRYDTCIILFNDLVGVAESMKDELKMAQARLNLGIAFRETRDYDKALALHLEAAPVIEQKGSILLQAKLFDALQVLYNYRSEYEKAIAYGEKALPVARRGSDYAQLSKCLANLALTYIQTGQFAKAEPMLLECLAMAREKNDQWVQSAVLMNLADIARNQRDGLKLIGYSRQSLAMNRAIGSVDGEALALRAIGTGYLLQKNADSALSYGLAAYHLDTTHQLRQETIETMSLLSDVYLFKGDVTTGYAYFDRFNKEVESMIGEITTQQSAELEKKYLTEQKENQIALQQVELQRRRMFNYILLGGAFVLLLVFVLSWRTYRQKQKLQQQKINELETEKQLAATEAVLKGEEQERTRLAKDLHDGLGGMLSGIKYSLNSMKGNLVMTPDNARAFERSMDMLDTSIQEMRRVAHNMMPEALVKFGLDTALRDFCNDIKQTGALKLRYQSIGWKNEDIDPIMAITLYRIIQELINNTMKHAGATSAIVQVARLDEHLEITVEDDGRGWDSSSLPESGGMGWRNIRNRVEFLKGRVDITSSPGKGTSVMIEIPM